MRSSPLSAHRSRGFATLVAALATFAAACDADPVASATGGSGGVSDTSVGDGSGDATTGADGATTSVTGTGGPATTGGGVGCQPEGTFDGAPVEGEANTWTWVDVPESSCRDGSPTGFGVRINPSSDKLFIYFEGGGACFNALTCGLNFSSYGASSFAGFANGGGKSGVFDTTNDDNPLRDWNVVFVPYCTGDVHAGDATDVDVPGPTAPKGQSFTGYRNVGHFLERIVPTFPQLTRVVVTGSSAGGFGAAYNFDRIAQAFCPTPAVLLDDSGPAMSDAYLAPCLQTRWRELWGLDATLPAGCSACTGADGGGIVHMWSYLATRHPGARIGLLSTEQDNTIRMFYGFGDNACANVDGLVPFAMSGDRFAEGLADLRDNVFADDDAFSIYVAPGAGHTFLAGSGLASTTVDDVALTTWVAELIDGGSPADVGP